MLNASGKAKTSHRNGYIDSILYHADDRPAAVAAMRTHAPENSTVVAIERGKGRVDWYVVKTDDDGTHRLDYVSKIVGSILGRRIHDGPTTNGVDGCQYPDDEIHTVSRAVFGYETGYKLQVIPA